MKLLCLVSWVAGYARKVLSQSREGRLYVSNECNSACHRTPGMNTGFIRVAHCWNSFWNGHFIVFWSHMFAGMSSNFVSLEADPSWKMPHETIVKVETRGLSDTCALTHCWTVRNWTIEASLPTPILTFGCLISLNPSLNKRRPFIVIFTSFSQIFVQTIRYLLLSWFDVQRFLTISFINRKFFMSDPRFCIRTMPLFTSQVKRILLCVRC